MKPDNVILITGATGFIGKALVDGLIKKGYKLALLVNRRPIHETWHGNVEVVNADLTREDEVFRIRDLSYGAVVHLAAHIPQRDDFSEYGRCMEVNAKGTNNILEFARRRGIRRFVYGSSAILYGVSRKVRVYKESRRILPETYYGMSKFMGELLCSKYTELYGVRVASLRYAFVYGEGMPAHFVFGKFLSRAKQGDDIVIHGTGAAARDFVYLKDVVSATVLALENDGVGCYNVGTGVGRSLLQLAEHIVRLTGSASKIICNNDSREDILYPALDIAKAKRSFGYSPVFDLEGGLKDYLENQLQ